MRKGGNKKIKRNIKAKLRLVAYHHKLTRKMDCWNSAPHNDIVRSKALAMGELRQWREVYRI